MTKVQKTVDTMKLVELTGEEAKRYFLKGSSYFNSDMPSYISFEPILASVASILELHVFSAWKGWKNASKHSRVNYH